MRGGSIATTVWHGVHSLVSAWSQRIPWVSPPARASFPLNGKDMMRVNDPGFASFRPTSVPARGASTSLAPVRRCECPPDIHDNPVYLLRGVWLDRRRRWPVWPSASLSRRLPSYSSKTSCQDFTRHQLVAILVLRQFFRTDLRCKCKATADVRQ